MVAGQPLARVECGGWTATGKGRVCWLESQDAVHTHWKGKKCVGMLVTLAFCLQAFQLLKPGNSMGKRLHSSGEYVKGEAMCLPEYATWVHHPGEDSQVLIPPEDLPQVEAWEAEKIRQWEERKKQRTNPVHEVADEVEFKEEQQQDVQASCTDLEIQKKTVILYSQLLWSHHCKQEKKCVSDGWIAMHVVWWLDWIATGKGRVWWLDSHLLALLTILSSRWVKGNIFLTSSKSWCCNPH